MAWRMVPLSNSSTVFAAMAWGSSKGNKRPAFVIQQFDGVEVGRGNDRFSSAQGVRQGAGNHLSLVFVRRDVNIRSANQFDQFRGTHEAVPENYVVLNSEVSRQLL